VYQIMTSRIRA